MCDKSKSSSSWFFLHRIWFDFFYFDSSHHRDVSRKKMLNQTFPSHFDQQIFSYIMLFTAPAQADDEKMECGKIAMAQKALISLRISICDMCRDFLYFYCVKSSLSSILDIHWNILDISSGWQGLDLDMHFTPNTDVLWRCNEIQLPNW